MNRPLHAALVGLLAVTAAAQQVAAPPVVDLDAVRADIRQALEDQHVPGLSIAVVVADQLVWSEGFGFADLEAGARATGSTIYRIGSVSKPIVGTALMQLVERGEVDLDVELQRYVPEFPRKEHPITVRHLLTHTSGIRHYRGTEFASMKAYRGLVEPLAIFKDDPLLFEPGTRFSYSTYGFNLVANVVENRSGQPIAEYMREHVFGPAWMSSTGLEDQKRVTPGRAKWYATGANGEWINAPYVDLSNKYAGGGLTSTVEDLARLHIAYARGKLLSKATIEQMYTPHRFPDGKVHSYALAWRVSEVDLPGGGADGAKVRRVEHSGGSMGANTLFHRYPDQGFAVAMVANHRARLGEIMAGVTRRFAAGGAFESRR